MKKRLIDANTLESYLLVLFKFFGSLPCSEADKSTQRAIKRCIGEVKKMPTVDAVEVVYCNCCVNHGNCLPEDVFRIARIEKPYCCAGKKDGERNA